MERNRLNEASGQIFEIGAAKSLRLNSSYENVEPSGKPYLPWRKALQERYSTKPIEEIRDLRAEQV